MANALVWLIVILIVAAILIAIAARFYERGTREVSLVKTGVGGRKVILDGGTLAVPYFHDITRVNMQTLRLEVRRSGEAALITKDKLRVDVGVEFYVSVISTEEGVARAAQTLGNRTFNPDKLRELIEGKLIDALRSVAARFTMDELHENRGDFVTQVRAGLVESLERNGLELDSVSLTAMDQTPFKALDENNAFNAVGMRKLAEVIAKSKKDRAEIDADAEVSVRQAAMSAAKRKLDIDLEEEQARILQVQKIETLRAAQIAEIAARKADSERAAAQARIDMESAIRSANIAQEQTLRQAELERDRQVEEAEVKRRLALELADQERQIQLHAKVEEESKVKALSDMARAEAIKAAERIATEKALAEAERRKRIAELAAEQEAATAGIRIRQTAKAELEASTDRAKARIEEASAETEVRSLRAEARKRELLAEAEGHRAHIEAENEMSERLVSLKTELSRLETLPKVMAEVVKPAEKIDSIKIHNVNGLGLGSGGAGSTEAGSARPVINQALDSIMDMAVQMPALRRIGEELGLSMDTNLKPPAGKDDAPSEKAKGKG